MKMKESVLTEKFEKKRWKKNLSLSLSLLIMFVCWGWALKPSLYRGVCFLRHLPPVLPYDNFTTPMGVRVYVCLMCEWVCVCVVHKTPLGLCIIEGSSTFRMNENARFGSFRVSPARTIERFHRKEEKNPEENLGSVTKRQKKLVTYKARLFEISPLILRFAYIPHTYTHFLSPSSPY